jgi:predicted dehydrogenase
VDIIRVGVIGVGHLGLLHAKMFGEIPNAAFLGIYDIDAEKAKRLASEFHIRAYDSIEELLTKVNAVSIATPTTTHFAIARKALEAGVHTFIEKPITETVEEAAVLCSLAAERNLKLQVGHIERFNPALLALEKYMLAPMFIESHRLDQFKPRGTDVPVTLDLMIHDIDIILSLVKSPVVNIEANGVGVVTEHVDIANARIQFENGCVANVTASRISQKKMRKMRMFQRNAYISVDFLQGVTEVFRMVDEKDATKPPDVPFMMATMLGQIEFGTIKRKIMYELPAVKEVNALKAELEFFLKAVREDTEPLVTGMDGKQALEVAAEIQRKIEHQPLKV